jgi:hypothetical protein
LSWGVDKIKDTYNSPRALHTKLYAKRACGECRETVRYDPQRNKYPGKDLAEPARGVSMKSCIPKRLRKVGDNGAEVRVQRIEQ